MTSPKRSVRRRSATTALALLPVAVLGPSVTASVSAAEAVTVVVSGTADAEATLPGLVERVGGSVTGVLDSVDAVVADVPTDRIAALRSAPGVVAVTADRTLHTAGGQDVVPVGWDAAQDPGSMFVVARNVRAHELWTRGYTGQGIDIAVLDTGVTDKALALPTGTKLLSGPGFNTLSSPIASIDGSGHGTHMAAIAAGATAGAGVPLAQRMGRGQFLGIAPDARIVPVKVAEETGATTLSQVLLGIEWTIANRNTEGRNIRVLNLSIAATPGLSPAEDPLAHGVVAAWNAGIVVVVSAGNTGTGTPLASPAYEPRVISVGALDHRGTPTATDDTIADFTAGGRTAATRADLYAPGTNILAVLSPSSRAAGSETKVGSGSDREYVRGSGTSRAAAVVSGAVALLLSHRPGLTPDQVAALLRAGALPVGTLPAARLDLLRSYQAATPAGTGTSAITARTARSAVGEIAFARRGATWSTDAWARRGATWSGEFSSDDWR